jgi:virginiamycin B lyase
MLHVAGRAFAVAAGAALAIAVTACADTDRAAPAPSPSPTRGDEAADLRIDRFPVPEGSHPHDVAPAPDGTVWYTAQASGELGRLDPADGSVDEVPLGEGSSPHGVIVGPDGAAWVTDTGLDAIVRVDPETLEARSFPSPRPDVGMHTAVFAPDGTLWFTGNAGFYGRLDIGSGEMEVFEAPGGGGPYGITTTPSGDVYFASLQQSYVAKVDPASGRATRIDPPTRGQGARRVWSDSKGRIWITYWNVGKLAVYDPGSEEFTERDMPGDAPQPYSVFVDADDIVWVSDFGANAMVRFDPSDASFQTLPLPSQPSNVRQMLGREGEVWGAESAADALVVVRTR